MIISFGSKETKAIWDGFVIKGKSIPLQESARRKLRMINSAQYLNDMKAPPAYRLEKLKGKLKGFYSIRINDQWRIIFKWRNGHAEHVEIIDYH